MLVRSIFFFHPITYSVGLRLRLSNAWIMYLKKNCGWEWKVSTLEMIIINEEEISFLQKFFDLFVCEMNYDVVLKNFM